MPGFPFPFTGPPPPPLVIVVSGPSGVGKTVLCERLVEADPSLVRAITATTRSPRPEERDGIDYYFWDEPRFRKEVAKGQMLEWAEVHRHLYGTPRASVETPLGKGQSPVLNLDVQGGRSVKLLLPGSLLIFVAPPSREELEVRLRGRGTDSEDEVRHRLEVATRELEEWRHYDYAVVNDVLEGAVERVRGIIIAERSRVSRLGGESGSGGGPRGGIPPSR